MTTTASVHGLALAARKAWQQYRYASAELRQRVLETLAGALEAQTQAVLEANAEDVRQARAAGLETALVDRLRLDHARLAEVIAGVRQVAALPDPLCGDFDARTLANGLRLAKRRVPLGVLGVVYEARPNVTVDVAALALKSGNAVILRGGSETLQSNRALVRVLHEALGQVGVPYALVALIDVADRALVLDLLRAQGLVDLIIPRGGAALHAFCAEHSRIPVIYGGIGICHLYVDASADLERALDVVENAKVQRPTVCNALDTVLVHRAVAERFLPLLAERLRPHGVELRAEPRALDALGGERPGVRAAGSKDFDTEWLSLVLGVAVVDDLDAAIGHVRAHSSGHSDGILTGTPANAARFLAEVDSAAVYVNASTRFTDGGQFGLGAEVAISTQRIHARGPMGLEALTSYKWVVEGDYHVRP